MTIFFSKHTLHLSLSRVHLPPRCGFGEREGHFPSNAISGTGHPRCFGFTRRDSRSSTRSPESASAFGSPSSIRPYPFFLSHFPASSPSKQCCQGSGSEQCLKLAVPQVSQAKIPGAENTESSARAFTGNGKESCLCP